MNSEGSNIEYELDGSIATVRLNRPEKLNAFTFAMIDQIRDAVERAAADEGVIAIVITGTGRAFSAGLDAGDLARSTKGGAPPSARDTAPDELPALFSYLLRVPKPVIAAVNGVTAGGGFVLAMMCDLRFASSDASFTTVFSKRGLIAEHGTAWLLPRIVGTSGVAHSIYCGARGASMPPRGIELDLSIAWYRTKTCLTRPRLICATSLRTSRRTRSP